MCSGKFCRSGFVLVAVVAVVTAAWVSKNRRLLADAFSWKVFGFLAKVLKSNMAW